jgi:Tol biopolymer transport system component
VAVADGRQDWLPQPPDLGIYEVAWLPDGDGLVALGSGWNGPATQIWLLSRTGKARRITNDLSFYFGLSVSADSKAIATAQTHRRANLWVVPASDPRSAHPIAREPEEEGLSYVRSSPSGKIIFTAPGGAGLEIWSLDPTSGGRTRLTPEGVLAAHLVVARETGLILLTSFDQEGIYHIFQMDADGGNFSQLTHGGGEGIAAVSPDGQSILYLDYANQGVWKMLRADGSSVKLWDQISNWYLFSPDGRLVLHDVYSEAGGIERRQMELAPIDGGPAVRTCDMPDGSSYRWAPSGDAITYVRDLDGVQNIWRQSLDGGAPEQITRFESGRIFNYDWSADGSQIFLSRGRETTDVVLITGFR